MANPTKTTRTTPSGTRMDDGYQSLIAFEGNAGILFWEKSITPPGLDGGEAIPTTTMHNSMWRTFAPMQLITSTEVTVRAAWDVDLYDEILSILNVEKSITVDFPTANRFYIFYGWLRSFVPGDMVEGAQPEATISIFVSNFDPINQLEVGPIIGT